MPPLLKRIVANGLLTSVFLALIGVGYAELAGLWLVAKSPARYDAQGHQAAVVDPNERLARDLKSRVPLMMALWGFLFVAGGELALHWWRSRRRPVPVVTPPAEPHPELAELLLDQIMSQVEAAKIVAPPSHSVPVNPVPEQVSAC
jgi:hypothetical protein